MKTFIRNWTCKKHIAAGVMFYTTLAMVGNALFKNPYGALEKNRSLTAACKAMPKKQKCFNQILLGCFALDMAASCILLKALKKLGS
ncbi:MAG TPA: hypothetical protein PLV37_01165 [Bacillota bacterium]|jgi:hypothetical protein|nr:hypothetical protein [Bacillota bacterium]